MATVNNVISLPYHEAQTICPDPGSFQEVLGLTHEYPDVEVALKVLKHSVTVRVIDSGFGFVFYLISCPQQFAAQQHIFTRNRSLRETSHLPERVCSYRRADVRKEESPEPQLAHIREFFYPRLRWVVKSSRETFEQASIFLGHLTCERGDDLTRGDRPDQVGKPMLVR